MGILRSRLSTMIRSKFRSRDVFIGQRGMFGLDAFADIHRLSESWSVDVKTIFDVGANDGDTAIAMLQSFPNAKVISFEPHPDTFKKLVERIGRKSCFSAFNIALADQIGEAEMTEYENSKVNSLIADALFASRFQKTGKTIPISAITLDAFSVEHPMATVDLLKIDTEGFELQVLDGSRKCFRQALSSMSTWNLSTLFRERVLLVAACCLQQSS